MNLGLISKVKKVKEVKITNDSDMEKINEFIQNDWILIRIVPNPDGNLFILGNLSQEFLSQI